MLKGYQWAGIIISLLLHMSVLFLPIPFRKFEQRKEPPLLIEFLVASSEEKNHKVAEGTKRVSVTRTHGYKAPKARTPLASSDHSKAMVSDKNTGISNAYPSPSETASQQNIKPTDKKETIPQPEIKKPLKNPQQLKEPKKQQHSGINNPEAEEPLKNPLQIKQPENQKHSGIKASSAEQGLIGSEAKEPSKAIASEQNREFSESNVLETTFGSEQGPSFIHRVVPEYPPLARRLGLEGEVLLLLTIDEKGNLKDIQVLKSSGYGFDKAAIKALRISRFKPAIKGGRPVASRATLRVRFRLR